ncbi:two-component system sensor histidine kinase RppB [Leptolyngbya sp. BC1307]|uniref:two-component system sensor histidine kinase RppB n=1 Tax=Leptolyngbya sp. BC1307 TaxID=2029589 RepID=UPI001F0A3312|nr:two-component system sensor histidine kinase RppB [Leptolyngbya sp. BC1307]
MPKPPRHPTQNQLFRQSRLQLAVWYTGVMGAILTLLGLGVYRAIAHAHEITIDREIKSVADAVHDAIEANISSPAQLDQVSPQLLPDLCLSEEACTQPITGSPHHLQRTYQYDYYIRIVDPAGNLLASGGIRPAGLPLTAPSPPWQTLQDESGQEYHQVAIALESDSPQAWAYLLIGRSFEDFNRYLTSVRWSLLIGLLLALAVVTIASWWLSGLAMRPIYQSYNQIQQFTADAAHELRTPLAAIRATVESVLRLPELSEAEAQETLTVINRQSYRLTTLVSDLLLLSRLDSEQRPLIKKPCCLQDLLSDINEEMAAFAISEGITLAVDFHSPVPLTVLGDEEQLYRLVLNLVNNAITYTPAGGQVTLTLKHTQQQAVISVRDTGIGIAPDHQEKIFDRFYRVDAARSGQSGSSGLGLAIASAIAKAHGGSITATSQPDQGSTFLFTLPVSMQTSPLSFKKGRS